MVFTIYGHGGHLGHVTWTIYITFVPPSQGCSTCSLAPTGQTVLEEKIFEIVDDGRTPDHGHPISSPQEPSAQVS